MVAYEKVIAMSLDSQLEKVYKDMSGSIAKNRLTIQISYAIKLIVDLYSVDDYTLLLDCIEDIVVKTVNAGVEKLFLYQVKTKNRGAFTLTYIINEQWFEKLYKHTKEFEGLNYEIALVSNVDIEDNQIIFPNEHSNLVTDIIEKEKDENKRRLYRIKKAISENEHISIDDVNLSNFYIIKTNLHCDTHKEQAQQILSDFIAQIDSSAELIKVKAFFTTLYNTLMYC